MAELADALDLGSSAIGVGVRLPSSAPLILLTTYKICGYRISANTPAFQAGKVGSIPTTRSIFLFFYALLAQLVEHLTLNQGVPGSNP